MMIKDLDLPIPYHPTHDVNDPSKIQAFQDCPRGFFFRYVLGWETQKSNVHFAFGTGWHDAMEYILNNGYTDETIVEAFQLFREPFLEAFPIEEEHDSLAPKNPTYAFKGLAKYVNMYRSIDQDLDVLYTEIAGTVPVREDRLIHTKVDSIVRAEDGIWSLEHKTTGRNSGPWREKWALIIQVGAYTHLVNSLFPDELVQGVKINGTILTKSRGAEFMRIPVRKNAQMMQEFLWEVNHWLDQMEWNFKALAECSPSDKVMMAFPKNSQSCSKFGCKYPGLCSAWQNPLQSCHTPPPGYEREFWDPRRENKEKANYVAEPDESGKVTLKEKEKTDKAIDEITED